jgi:hypothetical protein
LLSKIRVALYPKGDIEQYVSALRGHKATPHAAGQDMDAIRPTLFSTLAQLAAGKMLKITWTAG